MSNEQDNLKAGMFLLAGIVLAIAVVLLISWSQFRELLHPSESIAVYYPISEGLQGLSEGAAVTVGDVQVGSVKLIETHVQNDRPVGHIVRFDIPASYELGWDALVELVVPILGSSTTLNFRSLGSQPSYDPLAPMPEKIRNMMLPRAMRTHLLPDGMIPGRVASTLTRNLISNAMTIVGFEDEQRSQVKSILHRVDTLSEALVRRADRIGEKADALLENTNDAVSDVRSLIHSLTDRSALWMARLDSLTAHSDKTMAAVHDLVVGQSGKIDASVDTVHGVVETLNGEILPKVGALLDAAKVSMANMQRISETGRDLAVGQRPVVERTLANIHLMAEQLKLTAVEVRRSPWRLLYKPRESELETDNLYDSARSFAQGAASIEAAIAGIRGLAAVNPDIHAQLQPQLHYLEALQGRFREAEERFWRQLKAVDPP